MPRSSKRVHIAVWTVLLGLSAAAEARVTKIRPPRTFPYVISESGSYILDGNVTVDDENTTAFQIVADDVTLDLNGFTIAGPVVCTPTCTPLGGSGIGIDAPTANNVRVRNGTIRGMGSYALSLLGSYNRAERLTVISNGAAIAMNAGAMIRDCIASDNGGPGMYADRGSHISDAIATNNGAGIAGGQSVIIRRSITSTSTIDGISAGRGSLLAGNAANFSGHWSMYIDGDGAALGNVVSNSPGGLVTSGSIGYGQNLLWNNNGGNANQQGPSFSVEIGVNDCGDDMSCP